MKKLITAPLLAAALLLTGCGGNQEATESAAVQGEAQVETEGKKPSQGGLFKDEPLVVMKKSVELASEGDIKSACEHVIIEDFEQREDKVDCVEAYTVMLAFAGNQNTDIDINSGTVADPSPYGEGTTLISDIRTTEDTYLGCAVFSDKGQWKWHILETIYNGCANPPMD